MIGACPFFSAISPTRTAASTSLPPRPAKPYSLHCFAGFKLRPVRWRAGALKDDVEVNIGADDAADVAEVGVIEFPSLESEMEEDEMEEEKKDGCDSVEEVFVSKKKKDDVSEVKDYDRFKINNGREVFEEKAYLDGVECKGREVDNFGIEKSLKELAQLADTAGLLVVGSTHQKMSSYELMDSSFILLSRSTTQGRLPTIEETYGKDLTQKKHIKSFLRDEKENARNPDSLGSCSRRVILILPVVSSGLFRTYFALAKVKTNLFNENRLLEQNKKIQEANQAPKDFPNFIREGFQVKVVISNKYVKNSSGLIYLDIQVGNGDCPKDGQQVTFHYTGYNESGRRIDSTYLRGSPAKIRLGNNALVPGFEEGIHDMRSGGKRRIIIPPELGPPVGPGTFFSSKQFEVFDVELLNIKDCQRRTIAFYSDVVCN